MERVHHEDIVSGTCRHERQTNEFGNDWPNRDLIETCADCGRVVRRYYPEDVNEGMRTEIIKTGREDNIDTERIPYDPDRPAGVGNWAPGATHPMPKDLGHELSEIGPAAFADKYGYEPKGMSALSTAYKKRQNHTAYKKRQNHTEPSPPAPEEWLPALPRTDNLHPAVQGLIGLLPRSGEKVKRSRIDNLVVAFESVLLLIHFADEDPA